MKKILSAFLAITLAYPAIIFADMSDKEFETAYGQIFQEAKEKDDRVKHSLPPEDQKAYDALRDKGVSADEAKGAASRLRQFCQAAGGKDCE